MYFMNSPTIPGQNRRGEKAATRVGRLSGGQLRRMAVALGVQGRPELVFLDEPTAGLDPIAAAAFDQLILSLQKRLGLTVFLSAGSP